MDMTLRLLQRRRPASDRRPALEPEAAPATPACDALEQRVRSSGGPQDLAHYGCACGYQFTARVDTHVACPHCGGDQAW